MTSSYFDNAGNWTLVIHGGAGMLERGRLPQDEDGLARAGLGQALDAGGEILKRGGSALDATEAAVKVLEADPHFNAGRGAVFTYEGRNELDAAIMDGASLRAGAVAGLTRSKNPISVARSVMEQGAHVFLTGEGADLFSQEHGLEQVDPAYFRTEERWRQLTEMRAAGGTLFDANLKYGTVGAVAIDSHGHVASATSTGGLTGKRWGRVGDTPVIGAGTYADDRSGAVSATGAGEYFIRLGVGHEICARMRLAGDQAQTAADCVIAELSTLGGTGGVIVVAPHGGCGWAFNTSGMYRGIINGNGNRRIAIYGNE